MAGMTEFTDTSHDVRYKSMSDLSVWNLGFEDCVPGWEYGPTIRPYYLIHFVRRGRGELIINGMTRQIQAGQAFLIPAETVSWYQASRNDPWSYAWVGFMGAKAEHYFRSLLTFAAGTCVLNLPDIERYAQLIEEGARLEGASEQNYFHSLSLLLRILSLLEEDTGAMSQHNTHAGVIDEVRLYLDMKYTSRLKMDAVARRFGLHPNYMTRAFREKFGITPKKYLEEMKMKKACQLLLETDMPINLIAESIGMEDPLAFSKSFRARYQTSPRQFRKDAAAHSAASASS